MRAVVWCNYRVAATPRLWQRHVVSVCNENGQASFGRSHSIALVILWGGGGGERATTMRFASQLPRDAAMCTSFTSRPQLRRHPLQRIQPFITTSSNYWLPTYSNHFAIRPQLRWTPLQRNPPVFAKTNLSKTTSCHSTHAIGSNYTHAQMNTSSSSCLPL